MATLSKPSSRRALCGLVQRKEQWTLSRRGWLLLLMLLAAGALGCFFGIHPFLAVTKRVDAEVLVVEGWIPDPAFKECVVEFSTHQYRKVFTTGGPALGRGPVSQFDTFAHAGFVALLGRGIPAESLQKVPALASKRDRTYASAAALRDWLREKHFALSSLNVITSDVHARRTRLLFQKALGPQVKVGIISIPSQDYEASRWYRYSDGVKEVISEGAGYLYARFFFHPDNQD